MQGVGGCHPCGLVSPVTESLRNECMVLTELVSWQFSFTGRESPVTILGSAVLGWAGCTALLRLPGHNPGVANVLAGDCPPSTLKVRKVGNSTEVGADGGPIFPRSKSPTHHPAGGLPLVWSTTPLELQSSLTF